MDYDKLTGLPSIQQREAEAKEFTDQFLKEFAIRFGVTPSVYYSLRKKKNNIPLQDIMSIADEILRIDPEYQNGDSIKKRTNKRYIVIHRQCACKFAHDLGYGPSIIASCVGIDHATVIYSVKSVNNLLKTKDKTTRAICNDIYYELQKRYGFKGDVQSHNRSGIDSEPILHAL